MYMSETGVVSEFEYYGHDCRIERVEDSASPYTYEFKAYVDGELVTTATELENKGYTNPWIPTLEDYIKEEYLEG